MALTFGLVATIVADVVETSFLTVLDLSNNDISDPGFEAILTVRCR